MNQVQTQNPEKKPETVVSLLASNDFKKQIELALPKHMDGSRMARIALTEFRKSPKLGNCSIASFASSILTASQLGLEIGSAFGQCYLLPYGQECQLIVGYRGMIQLAHRSGQLKNIHADIVYEGDVFEVELGMNMTFKHKPVNFEKNKNQIKAVYAYAHLSSGGFEFVVLNMKEIEKIQKKSKSQNIWGEHFEEMAKKTAIRRLFKLLPVSSEIVRAISIEDARETGDRSLMMDNDFIDAIPTEQPTKSDILADQILQEQQKELTSDNSADQSFLEELN